MQELKKLIRDVKDFPKEGILFRDISTLINDKEGFKKVIDLAYERYKDMKIDYILGIEARGFIFATPLAYKLGVGFIPVRKPGKLPSEVVSYSYDLEYGKDSLEIHKDAFKKGDKILIVDDLLATGGTAAAAVKLVEKMGGNIEEIFFLIELNDLNGREKLKNQKIFSMITY
ncbi:MAG: adenine phosphoribosyltransferase [Fusobacteriia bacterium 4572_132]|nr:MAG: adenine phosphoribosyltransferase [Fusobacteriia bacterium 4572_132]